MSKINKIKLSVEAKSFLQSARAKNRKGAIALGNAAVHGAKVPASIVAKMKAVDEYLNSQLALATAKPAQEEPEVIDTQDDDGAYPGENLKIA